MIRYYSILPGNYKWAEAANGDLQLVYPNGSVIQFENAGQGTLFMGAGNNFQVGMNGIISVYGTYETGAGGIPAILGQSPNPAENIGPGQQYGSSTHTFTTQGPATVNIGGFVPPSGTKIGWHLLEGYLHISAVAGSPTVKVQVTYTDEAGNSQTDTLSLISASGTPAASATGTGYYHFSWFGPNKQPATQTNPATNNIITVNVVESGVGSTFTGVSAFTLMSVGVIGANQ